MKNKKRRQGATIFIALAIIPFVQRILMALWQFLGRLMQSIDAMGFTLAKLSFGTQRDESGHKDR